MRQAYIICLEIKIEFNSITIFSEKPYYILFKCALKELCIIIYYFNIKLSVKYLMT